MTFVTRNRSPWLRTDEARMAMLVAMRNWHEEGEGVILAATVMPDHVHVLFELGGRLDVGRCVSRWKTVARRECGYLGDWQRDFWERRVRDDESAEEYALYILPNPHRAGLAKCGEAWAGWLMPTPDRFRFSSTLGPRGEPPEEWINWPAERFTGLATGE